MGHPRCLFGMQPCCVVVLGFVFVEFGGVSESEADVVEAFEEAELAEGIDFEGGLETAVIGYGLILKRDGEFVAGDRLCVAEQRVDFGFAEANEDDAVLTSIGEEYVGEGG